ncbi:cyclophilin-like fold protein [Nocardioides lijunqiniae]|uniref:cyclophilin-like fold protein n=1 Tax=Nocardioides lijunqiniae TaxID=2760832 RepID=UPI001877BD5A|nr:cyclophilin-like fold protein [Nocardioides lijunqiniae]
MTAYRALRGAAAALLAVAVLAGCSRATEDDGGTEQPSGDAAGQEPGSGTSGTPEPEPEPRRPDRSRGAKAQNDQEAVMQIQIRVGGETFTATVDDSRAGRDLLAQLPQTIEMSDHGGVEKTGPLLSPLSLDGQPVGADPDAGDLGYYAPGNDLVLYYGDQSYYDGIVVLGRLDDRATTRLAEIEGDITATVTDAP